MISPEEIREINIYRCTYDKGFEEGFVEGVARAQNELISQVSPNIYGGALIRVSFIRIFDSLIEDIE